MERLKALCKRNPDFMNELNETTNFMVQKKSSQEPFRAKSRRIRVKQVRRLHRKQLLSPNDQADTSNEQAGKDNNEVLCMNIPY